MDITESLMPGIGMKYTFQSVNGQISVVIKSDGFKEIYYAEDSNFLVIPLSEEDAKVLSMLLLETSVNFKQGESTLNLGKSILKWVFVKEDKNEPIFKVEKNSIIFIRNGKIEKNLNDLAKAGDIILSGE
ncbi:MAG: hypothetical protein ACP5SF_00445 [Thermoplasmata archaeon]